MFEFDKCCLFCGKECIVEADPKHRDRFDRNPGVLCRTADRGKSKEGTKRKSFKEVLEEVSFCKKDSNRGRGSSTGFW